MASPFYTAEHEAYRDVVRRFVEKEIEPYAHEWDEAGGFPRQLYEKSSYPRRRVSSTLRLCDFITNASEYWITRFRG